MLMTFNFADIPSYSVCLVLSGTTKLDIL